MDCSCQDLMSALSSQKIQSDQDIVSKSLTLLQVCLLFKHFTCPIFHGSKCSLFSMCICVLFIYLTISLFHIHAQAIETRDAIAKFIYSSLFEWLLQQVNKSLEVGENHTEKSISILDICGFQSFQVCNLY